MIALLTPLMAVLGPLAVLLMMAVLFAETGLLVGFFLPGDSLLFTAGVLVAADVMHLPLVVVAAAAFVAAAVGDQVGYLMGAASARGCSAARAPASSHRPTPTARRRSSIGTGHGR